jgi:Tat protein secretion system quality control protein TatD with DNase activity
VSLKSVLDEVRGNLLKFPDAMVGEVGLDRSFRHAYQSYPSPPPRKLSPFTTPIEHQVTILEAQLDLAVELRRHVSLHSVNSNQATVGLLMKMKAKHQKAWREISIDMHSCSLSLEAWRDLEVRRFEDHENECYPCDSA